MTQPTVFFVGRSDEVAHHAAPFRERLNVRIADATEVLASAQPADLAIFYSEHFDRFRDCCQQLKQRSVATVYLVDGILEWRNAWENRADEVACPYAMRPVLAHKVACIGPSQARVLESWGNVGKTEVIGIPRLDRLVGTGPVKESPGEFRVLVITAKTPGFTPQQWSTVLEGLRNLRDWQSQNGEIEGRQTKFKWRLTGGLAHEIGVESSVDDLTGVELEQDLAGADAVITTPSTAMLEAMLMDRPVALLDYHNCPHYVAAGWTIGGPSQIDSVIRQLAERSESRMHFQRHQLSDALAFEGSATDRLVELVETMVKIAGTQVARGDSLEFPGRIVSEMASGLPRFNHRAIYPDVSEFSQQDLSVLQVELSHARREIKCLQGEIAQLQSELEQAHQIFEQIEQHPIAGPVVRMRQKMLDLMVTLRQHQHKNKHDSGGSDGASQPKPTQAESAN